MKSYDPGGNGVFKEKERQAPLLTPAIQQGHAALAATSGRAV